MVTWKKITFAVCCKPDSKSPQYLSLKDLEQNEIFRESTSILQQRAGFSYVFHLAHAYLIFTLFRVIDRALLSYLINFPFSYNTFFSLHSIFTNLPNNFYLFISAFATCGLCFNFILLQGF